MSKVLIIYKDWLLKTRGKIEPKVGDEVLFIHNDYEQVHVPDYIKGFTEISVWFEDGVTRKFDKCWVEIELPEIEWIDYTKSKTKYRGYINNLLLFEIILFPLMPKDKEWIVESFCKLKDVETHPLKSTWSFQGTLEECKQEANKLIFNL